MQRIVVLLLALLWGLRGFKPGLFDQLSTAILLFLSLVFVAVTSNCFSRWPHFVEQLFALPVAD